MAAVGVCGPTVRSRRPLGGALQEPSSCLGLLRLIHHVCIVHATTLQAYKHIFTSPSSVEKEATATRSGNARIHGMTRVTTGSLAYVATQVCPASRLSQLTTDHAASFALRCHLRQCSAGLTLQRTLNGSMRASWNSWIIRMRRMTLAIC